MEGQYFRELNVALEQLLITAPDLRTLEFTALVDKTLNVFDYLGMVMGFAKVEASGKCASLKQVADKLPTLNEVVAADKRTGTVTVKNSCSRNLHRLLMMVSFIRLLMENLMANRSTGLRQAAVAAYAGSLQPYHTYMLRSAIWAGLYALPTRQTFLKTLGEDEDSAHAHALIFTTGAKTVIQRLESLYDTPMPASDSTGWFQSTPQPAPAPA